MRIILDFILYFYDFMYKIIKELDDLYPKIFIRKPYLERSSAMGVKTIAQFVGFRVGTCEFIEKNRLILKVSVEMGCDIVI